MLTQDWVSLYPLLYLACKPRRPELLRSVIYLLSYFKSALSFSASSAVFGNRFRSIWPSSALIVELRLVSGGSLKEIDKVLLLLNLPRASGP